MYLDDVTLTGEFHNLEGLSLFEGLAVVQPISEHYRCHLDIQNVEVDEMKRWMLREEDIDMVFLGQGELRERSMILAYFHRVSLDCVS